MKRKLSPNQLDRLRELEPLLQRAVNAGDCGKAEAAAKRIQALFVNDRDHYRVLKAKNWLYECFISSGQTAEAQIGLEAVRLRAKEGTRVYLEATSLLAICYLRSGEIENAKKLLRIVIENINSIQSDARRRQFHKRLLQRIRDEIFLGQLIGRDEGELDPEKIQSEAAKLLQEKSPDEIFRMIGDLMPRGTAGLLRSVEDYAVKLLPPADLKLLMPAQEALSKQAIGEKTLAAVKRIAWRTFCDSESQIYDLWKRKSVTVFSKGYFAAAFVSTLHQWKIGLPTLAAGVLAVAMRFGCAEFCDAFRPEGLMIPRTERD